MEQPLKQRLIGATIIISLVVIFVPMLIGERPNEPEELSLDIPEPPQNLESEILSLPEQTNEPVASIVIDKTGDVEVVKPVIPEPPKVEVKAPIESWVIQVGAFGEKANADNLAKTLQKAGFVAFVEPAKTDKGTSFRVRVGPEISEKKAEAVKEKLVAQQKLDKAIVLKYP